MCITIHQTLLSPDDSNASLAFDRDTLASRSAATSDTAKCAGPYEPPIAAVTGSDGDTMSTATEVLRNG